MAKNTLTDEQVEILGDFLEEIKEFQAAIPVVHLEFKHLQKVRRDLGKLKTAVDDLIYVNKCANDPLILDSDMVESQLEKFESSCVNSSLFKALESDEIIPEPKNIRSIREALNDLWSDVCAVFGFNKPENKHAMGLAKKNTMESFRAIKTQFLQTKEGPIQPLTSEGETDDADVIQL